jgi:hypothetical protein
VEESKEPRPEESQGLPRLRDGNGCGRAEPGTAGEGDLLSADEAGAPSGVATAASVTSAVVPAGGGPGNLLATSLVAAIVAFVAVGIFVLGMRTHAIMESDDDGGGAAAQVPAQPTQPAEADQPTAAPLVEATVTMIPARGPRTPRLRSSSSATSSARSAPASTPRRCLR